MICTAIANDYAVHWIGVLWRLWTFDRSAGFSYYELGLPAQGRKRAPYNHKMYDVQLIY